MNSMKENRKLLRTNGKLIREMHITAEICAVKRKPWLKI